MYLLEMSCALNACVRNSTETERRTCRRNNTQRRTRVRNSIEKENSIYTLYACVRKVMYFKCIIC